MKKISTCITFVFFIFLINATSKAQFVVREGKWKGKMKIYQESVALDSIDVIMSITPRIKDSVWQWKTEYLSPKMPMTKDYELRVFDRKKGAYITDEGDGVLLSDYGFGNKLMSHFSTEGIMLTATYEWIGNRLIFEVTSGKADSNSSSGVTPYTIKHLQRGELIKE